MVFDGDAAAGTPAVSGGPAGRPTIGFVSLLVHGFYFGGLLDGVLAAAADRDCRVVAIQTLDTGLHVDGVRARLNSRPTTQVAWNRLDAMVVVQHPLKDEYLHDFVRTGKPLVGICREIGDMAFPTVMVDNRGGIVASLDHVLTHGHTRIAFVSHDPPSSDDDVRLQAYQSAMRERGLEPSDPVRFEWDLSGSQPQDLVRRLLAGKHPPTAVVAATDMVAFDVIKMLNAVGVSVPGDIAVVGFDDVEDAATCRPPLTTVAQSFALTGRMAADLLIDAIEGHPAEPTYHHTPVTLVVRESCGCGLAETDDSALAAPATGSAVGVAAAGAGRFRWALNAMIEHDPRLTTPQRARLMAAGEQLVAMFAPHEPVCGSSGQVEAVVRELTPLLVATSSLLHLVDLVRELGASVVPAPGQDRHGTGIDRLVGDVTRALIEGHHRQVLERPTTFESFKIRRLYYVISARLLRHGNCDAVSLDWLADTEVSAGCLGLWAGDGDDRHRPLRVVGTYDEHGSYRAGDEPCLTQDFPPSTFVDLLDRYPGALLYLVAVRFDVSDWGFLALVGQLPVQDEPMFERFNHWAALLTVTLDQDQAMRSERALLDEIRSSEERYALAAEAANDGLWDWNLTSGMVYYSNRWKALIGHADDEIDPRIDEWLGRIHPDDRRVVEKAIADHRAGLTANLELEYRLRDVYGTYRWMATEGRSMCDESGRAVRLIGSMTDITDQKLLEDRLRHDALYDKLTGLPNRTLYLDRLGQQIEHARRSPDAVFAVVFFDLNGFKVINDSLGHEIGDKVLVETGRRLVEAARSGDTVARFGGDEFMVLLTDVGDAASASTTVRRILAALSVPMSLDGRILTVGAAAGIAVSTTGYHGVEEFLRDADAAMYRAKGLGNGAVVLFDRSMHAEAVARLQLELDLRKAVADDQFELYYQPILRLDERRIVGVEALIRWHHPARGLVSPDDFLPVAEAAGLIQNIGRWTVRAACGQLRAWLSGVGLPDDFTVAVNLSNRQFWDPDLCSYVREALADFGVPPTRLVLEVTEGVIMHNHDQALAIMDRLRAGAVRLQLDDFGTGYASLATLQTFPVDAFKIDKSFTGRIRHDDKSRELVRIMLAMGRTFGVEVVAEGVETEDDAAMLAEMGCPLAQGYLFSRPVPAPELPPLLG